VQLPSCRYILILEAVEGLLSVPFLRGEQSFSDQAGSDVARGLPVSESGFHGNRAHARGDVAGVYVGMIGQHKGNGFLARG